MTNLRVYRQNSLRTILVWDVDQKIDQINIFKDDVPIRFEKFIPPSDKFKKKTDGILIYHKENGINPFEDFILRLEFLSNGKLVSIDKEIFALSTVKKDSDVSDPKIIYVYGYDYNQKKWVPFPVNPLLKEVKNG